MSSWANRTIPRKRDLSHIPDVYRPTIITRAENPHVVLSETFQTKTPMNEIVEPSPFDMFLRRPTERPVDHTQRLPTPSKAPAPRAGNASKYVPRTCSRWRRPAF